MGYKNWKGDPLTFKKVINIRKVYGLKSRFERLREQGLLTGDEMAKKLEVSIATVHNFGKVGFLQRQLYGNNKRCLYEPIPENYVFVKGQGGPIPTPPKFIIIQSSKRGAI